MENATKSIKNDLVEYDMGYDIVEDINKMKAIISLFELYNLPPAKKEASGIFWSTTQ